MDPSLKVGNNSTDKSENVIGPCLLYRLCEIPTKLWRDKNELHLLDLVHQYRYVGILGVITDVKSHSVASIL